ncbi:hypothetical protein ACF09Y_09100 [Streptomyces massasporeus]|uniref:hypothetical protein n=1 Tax=Streptomyces massasporeus TaxID=67324 RepID=UPI0037005F77
METSEGHPEPEWDIRPARPADVEAIAELRAVVMRPDLERLGRYDGHRVRQRLRDGFSPRHTSIITSEGTFAGSVTLRPSDSGLWLEHFYLTPALQGRHRAEGEAHPCPNRRTYRRCQGVSTACRS